MRVVMLLATTSLLAACGGGSGAGPQTVASAPPPVTGGSNTGSGGGTANTEHSFANPTIAKTYVGIGGNQVYEYSTDDRVTRGQQGIMYAGNSTTIRDSSIEITYDPASSIYHLTVSDDETGAGANTRFQDPASRTDFGGAIEPQWGTPNISNPNIKYLQAGDGNPRAPFSRSGSGFVSYGDNDSPPTGMSGSAYQATSLFLLQPGTETQYVTYAGYVRNALTFSEFSFNDEVDEEGNVIVHEQTRWHLERGAFAFGDRTGNGDVPISGSGNYNGSMLASLVYNPTIDGQDPLGPTSLPTYFQWVEGTASIAINFAQNAFDIELNGTVLAPQIDYWSEPATSVLPAGTQFAATGKGDVNLISFGGFKGFIDSARFSGAGVNREVAVEGSTVDGAFYGPNGEEVGGGFRIVGGNPDERVDMVGAFTGKQ